MQTDKREIAPGIFLCRETSASKPGPKSVWRLHLYEGEQYRGWVRATTTYRGKGFKVNLWHHTPYASVEIFTHDEALANAFLEACAHVLFPATP